jgi:hypothetical protein
MALIYSYGETPLDESFAKEAAEVLTAAYPNHGWWVECRQGVLIVKHFEASGYRGLVGMLRKVSQLSHDAAARKREIVRAAGELLERAYLPRGRRSDHPVTKMDLDAPLRRFWSPPA